jgi:hypothetical protein
VIASGLTRALRCSVAIVAIPLLIAFAGSGTAEAGLGASATPTFPTTVTVGNTGLAASIQLQNLNTPPNTSSTVCNVGDPLPCPVGDLGITLIPSCGQLGAFSACSVGDPGVLQVSATALGAPGTACAGMTFTVTMIDPAFGRLRFAPPPGTHVQLSAPGSPGAICRIDFTFDVLKSPTIDQDPATPGSQTVQVVDNTQHDGGSITASGRGTSNGTTVQRATPTIATTPTQTIPVGSGQLADAATVSGRVNPQPGATVDFRLYGPNDATCAGVPAFESLGVPYPVAGGPVTSAAFTPIAAGMYRWIATYSGDANNLPVSGACGDSSETVAVTPATPAISTTPTPPINVGSGQLADVATVFGRVSPLAGATIDFRLYAPGDTTCVGAPVFQSLGVPYPVAGGPVMSAPYTPIVPGVYRWIATYSGDANNLPVSGVCSDASESVTVTPAVPVASEAPPPGGPTLPATGSPSGAIVFIAFALCLSGGLLVVSTSIRRRPAMRRSPRVSGWRA